MSSGFLLHLQPARAICTQPGIGSYQSSLMAPETSYASGLVSLLPTGVFEHMAGTEISLFPADHLCHVLDCLQWHLCRADHPI